MKILVLLALVACLFAWKKDIVESKLSEVEKTVKCTVHELQSDFDFEVLEVSISDQLHCKLNKLAKITK